MSKAVPSTPPGYHSVTPYLTLRGAAAALDFYARAFGAQLVLRLDESPERIAHAEIKIGDSHVMLSDEYPDMGALSPATLGGVSSHLMIYCDDCDALFRQALAAGATSLREPADQFYGDRSAQVQDPFGHRWTLATHIEDVDQAEIERRLAAMAAGS
jgi:PhnB protein